MEATNLSFYVLNITGNIKHETIYSVVLFFFCSGFSISYLAPRDLHRRAALEYVSPRF